MKCPTCNSKMAIEIDGEYLECTSCPEIAEISEEAKAKYEKEQNRLTKKYR